MQLYDKLLGLPLFQGLSSGDLQDIVTKVKFGFYKYNRGAVLADEGSPCGGLIFVLDGEVEMKSTSADYSFSFTEYPKVPFVIEPERIFGLHQHYARRYVALSQCHCLYVQKDDVMLLTTDFMVFRLNLLNIISTNSQRLSRMLWRHVAEGTEERVINFIRTHCAIPSGKKVIHIKMQKLADEINDSRLDVSVCLNRLDDEAKIILQRGIVTVPRLENL